MESRIPLPTDNIFKFYALFGLLLFIFGFGSALYTNELTNEKIFQTAIELESVNSKIAYTSVDEVRKTALKRKLEIVISDKKFYLYACNGLVAIAVFMMMYGFGKWHKEIQPIQDDMIKLQLKKLQLEVGNLQKRNARIRANK